MEPFFQRVGAVTLVVVAAAGCSGADEDDPTLGVVPDASNEVGADVDGSREADAASEVAPDVAGEDVTSEDVTSADAVEDSVGFEAEAASEQAAAPCPADMVLVGAACMDRFEAPNKSGELPFVMFHFNEADSWCTHRGKRLCFDDEWTQACGGPDGLHYPYGDTLDPGVCNDDKVWKAYDQTLLNGWPWTLDTDPIESLDELLNAARAKGATGKAAADHVQALYQGTACGDKAGCVGPAEVYDLTGNVEEWTRRRDGGEPSFHGNLKGRYWAESRTCQQGVTTHGDTFRFYEIGFRCCLDP